VDAIYLLFVRDKKLFTEAAGPSKHAGVNSGIRCSRTTLICRRIL